jgi:DHA2 family multidrug resistance protein
MACGLATTLPEMVLFRALQGMFGAGMAPLAQAILLNINPPDRHPRAMAIWGLGSILGPIIGPVVGGYLTEELSWRWCFFINLPVGLLSMTGLWMFMSSKRRGPARAFDFLGFGSLAIAVGFLQLMLDRGPGLDWFSSAEVCGEGIIAAIGLWVFVAHTLTARNPLFSIALLRNRNLALGGGFAFVTAMVIFGSLALLPLMIQTVMDYPVLTAGLVSLPRGLGMIIAMLIIGRFSNRINPQMLLAAALATCAVAFQQMTSFDLMMGMQPLIVTGFIQGVGTGMFFVPLTMLAFATIRAEERPDASSLYNMLRNLGASVGISVMQAMTVYNTQVAHASMAARVTPADPVFRWSLPALFDPAIPTGALALNAEITRQAKMVAYVDAFWMMLVLTLVCIPFLWLLRPAKTASEG